MQKLTWEMWRRTPGCRHWMDVTKFGTTSFTDIFYRGMRMVFMDEQGSPGLLYRGKVYERFEGLIASNGGKRVGFKPDDELWYIRDGFFKYDNTTQTLDGGELVFSGPDAGDLAKPQYMNTTETAHGGVNLVKLNFYNITNDATFGKGSFDPVDGLVVNDYGANYLGLFVGALVLHEIMHHHGFHHTHHADYSQESDYMCSLPVLAWQAAMDAGMDELGVFAWWAMQKVTPPRCSTSG